MKKREVIRAEVLGFCMGVRGAIRKAEIAAVGAKDDKTVKTFGPLIHNRKALEELSRKGVDKIESTDDIEHGTVVIRAHGVERDIYNKLVEKGLEVIDGTCPLVLKSMRTVDRYSREGRHVILVGDATHGEIRALYGYASDVEVVENEEQALNANVPDGTMVIAQTTVSMEKYEKVCELLESRNPSIEVIDSICPATRNRQEALMRLSEKVEAIVVIGGKNSSNTKRLFELALKSGKPAWHIEEAAELPPEIRAYSIVGITAGASTPDWCIDEVEETIRLM